MLLEFCICDPLDLRGAGRGTEEEETGCVDFVIFAGNCWSIRVMKWDILWKMFKKDWRLWLLWRRWLLTIFVEEIFLESLCLLCFFLYMCDVFLLKSLKPQLTNEVCKWSVGKGERNSTTKRGCLSKLSLSNRREGRVVTVRKQGKEWKKNEEWLELKSERKSERRLIVSLWMFTLSLTLLTVVPWTLWLARCVQRAHRQRQSHEKTQRGDVWRNEKSRREGGKRMWMVSEAGQAR